MNAAETIAAAIAKLEETVALPGLAQASDDPETLIINGGQWAGEMGHPQAAYDVVTLHRTIDAQIAILRESEVWGISDATIDLARAILGEEANQMSATEPMTEEERHGPDRGRFPETCAKCNYDDHTCPGCGEWLHHGTHVCGQCRHEVERGER